MLNFSFFLPAQFRKTELHQHFYRASSIIFAIVMTFLASTSTGGAQEHSLPNLPNLPKPGSEWEEPTAPSLDLLKRASKSSCKRARYLAKEAMLKYDAEWDISLGKAYEEAYNEYVAAKGLCERLTKEYNDAVKKESRINKPPPPRQPPILGGSGAVNGWGASASGASYVGNTLRFTPPSDGRIDFFVAPSSFHGDWRVAQRLVFDKMSKGGKYSGPTDYPGGKGDVELYNGNMMAVYDIKRHHDGTWATFAIPLQGGAGWKFSGGARQLSDVLANVTGFRIRAEYGAGKDESALRNIRLE